MKHQEEVLELLRSTGAYLWGHFRLASGLHSPGYLQCARVLQFPGHAERLGQLLAAELRDLADGDVGLVVSPALGGVIIGHEVARALGTPFLFTERDPTERMALRRGFTATPGSAAVVVEDVITTGGSTREVADVLRAAGVNVAAAGSIIDRSGGEAEVGAPRVALATLQVPVHKPENCPLCQKMERLS